MKPDLLRYNHDNPLQLYDGLPADMLASSSAHRSVKARVRVRSRLGVLVPEVYIFQIA